MVVCGHGGVDAGCKYHLDEDASYYAEIEKQILELMEDGDEDDVVHFGRKSHGYDGSDSARVNRRSDVVVSYSLPPWNLFKMSGSGGTGVFIPQIVNRSTTSQSPWGTYPQLIQTKRDEELEWKKPQVQAKGEEPQLVGFQVPRRADQNLQLIA